MLKSIKTDLLATLTFVACPCSLPLMLVVLAGTSAGAWIGQNQGLVYGAATALFAISGYLLWRRMTDEEGAVQFEADEQLKDSALQTRQLIPEE